MNEEQETKKEWATPEIADLDVQETNKPFWTIEGSLGGLGAS